MTSHANRARWARTTSQALASELPRIDELIERGQAMTATASNEPELYDSELYEEHLAAWERRESLVTQAVVHAAAAIEGAYHGLTVAALGTDYAATLTRVGGIGWRWRLLVRIVWGADLQPGEAPLQSVQALFNSRNWLLHPSVVDVTTGKGVWREVTINGEPGYEPVDLSEFAKKVDDGWDAATAAALRVERTFEELADCIDGFDPSAGIRFELIET